jgi:hypothetical protein
MLAWFVGNLPYISPGVVGLVVGWYGHMKFGQKAQAVVDTVAVDAAKVSSDVKKLGG